jgi:hypothetical protein
VAHVPSKNSFDPHFLKIDPQLGRFYGQPKTEDESENWGANWGRTGDHFMDISPFLKNKTNKKML